MNWDNYAIMADYNEWWRRWRRRRHFVSDDTKNGYMRQTGQSNGRLVAPVIFV